MEAKCEQGGKRNSSMRPFLFCCFELLSLPLKSITFFYLQQFPKITQYVKNGHLKRKGMSHTHTHTHTW